MSGYVICEAARLTGFSASNWWSCSGETTATRMHQLVAEQILATDEQDCCSFVEFTPGIRAKASPRKSPGPPRRSR